MEFFYRVFTTVDKKLWLAEIEDYLEKEEIPLSAIPIVDEADEDNLDAEPIQILLVDAEDREVAILEFDALSDSEMLTEEVAEFRELVGEMLPERNRAWAVEKFAATTGCFAFQMLEDGFEEANWDAVATLAAWLRSETNGFEQSDGGQITNENGAVVLVVPYDEDEEKEEDDWRGCSVATLVDGAWVESELDSVAAFEKFLNGDA